MKTIIAFLLLFSFVALNAQTPDAMYNIIRINGQIYNISTGENLIQGNSLKPKDKLEFYQQAFGIVISNNKRKFTLRKPYDLGGSDDLFALAEMSLNPIQSRGQFSTRGIVGPGGVKDLKSYLSEETFNVIGKEIDIKLDKNLYPLNDDQFIVFHYNINDNKVSKKVGFNKQELNLNRDKLVVSKGDTLFSDTIPNVEVYQYEKSSGDTELITRANITFIDEDMLRKELLAIIPILKKGNSTEEEIREFLFEYFFDLYGNVDETQLNSFILKLVYQ
jgi:hypothetical protein